MKRGALIILEGCDCCGKTTQCEKIVGTLKTKGHNVKFQKFPDGKTQIGSMLRSYLENKSELEDHAVHLLFAANRWELMPKLKKDILAGITYIVDRYSYSGVAFSAAKTNMSLDWCQQPEVGLLQPDAVFQLKLNPEEAARRSSYGTERYETPIFQKKVANNYALLHQPFWQDIKADQTIEDLHDELLEKILEVMKESKEKEIKYLWQELQTQNN